MASFKKLKKEFKKLGSNYFIVDQITDQIIACDDIQHIDSYLDKATKEYKNYNIDYKITFDKIDTFTIKLNSTTQKYLKDF